jgi:penicillin-binding protein 1A
MSRSPRGVPPDRSSGRARAVARVAARSAAVRPDPKPARTRRLRFRLLGWTVIAAIWGGLALGAILLWFARDLPRPEAALDAARRPSLTLQDRSGQTLATFGDIVGDSLRLSEVPAFLPVAAVSVEDRRFWSHPGIDLLGMARAGYTNLRAGHVVQGGSTITQQVAKNLFLTNARTFRRKVQELMLTLWLEHSFSKNEILEIWLNRVYLGSGAWGMDAASRMYFGVSARKVTLWQAAVLAGLPRAPSRFNPRTNPEAAEARGRVVLTAMVEAGAISQHQAQAAAAQMDFTTVRPASPGWYADWVAEQSLTLLPANADAVVRSTLDLRLQDLAQLRLSAMIDGPGAAANVSQGAVIIMDPATGAVRAMVGGRDYRKSPFNRAVLAHRQPGSAFKPFVFLAAIEAGVTPDDTVLDAPIRVGNWSPMNFERRYAGDISVEEALVESVNTASVRLLQLAGGPRKVIAVAQSLGIAGKLPKDASLALGTGEVGLLELTAAYAAFFNGGQRVTPYGVDGVTADRQKLVLPRQAPEAVIGADEAAMMQRMLTAVVARGTGRAAGIPGHLVAGKTGTTQDYKDAWFIGWTSAGGGTLIGVWLGNDDNRPMRSVQGGGLPAKLFHDIALSLR